MGKLGNFILESKRVLKVTKKPSQKEFMATLKVAALGMLVIGLIGFVINLTTHMF
ncbi:protein translocase SEC61 complex subunit gamma [archaeon]|jgi:protein transport protein SEC61 subunit gamma and related proteins|nr:protein translocase SEC61 complex subunit gamma [archaeon]MBT4350983.1 protein translocase SEC61 complex subunit gamma [archaeon]MBT4647674.1 protein translocase SEC61 complex subunit gamma [archaeon]MBT6822211.1 protein translocase SEC61 complex subunit gamma [archaeon]MBT7391494.1 protein translocase SEC61 complex subunit gamma [archaeon]